MKQPIKFIYAVFAITLIGGFVTMYLLKNVYAHYSESSIAFAQAIDDMASSE